MDNVWYKLKKMFKRKFLSWSKKGYLNWIPDKLFLEIMFKIHMGYFLDLRNPKTLNEKMQWLKLYNHNPEYTNLVDKCEAKKVVGVKIGEEYIIPTLGVWNSFDEIDFDALPDQFVLKCTHDSGSVVICKDKSTFDVASAREKLVKGLNSNYFYRWREWPYKNVKPRIIAELFLMDEKSADLMDYKFFGFDGEMVIMFIITNRGKGTTRCDYFDKNFKHLEMEQEYPRSEKIEKIEKPKNFEKMVEFTCLLTKGMPLCRVDFFEINGKLFFGEMTFFDSSGFAPYNPPEWDRKLGDLIKLNLAYTNTRYR